MKLDRVLAIDLYKKMLLIRRFEEKVFVTFSTGAIPGTIHQCMGEEATNVGIAVNMSDRDYMTFTHRCHGLCLVRGVEPRKMLAEMFGKKTGVCKGMGGSIHYADAEHGLMGTNGIVGASVPQAVGAAWFCQYKETGGVAFSVFGDGCSNHGTVHESMNLASIWKLPIIFICVNNLYGFSMPFRLSTSVENIADRASAYSMPGVIMDGMDVEDVYAKVKDAVEYVRHGNGPILLESKTYRYRGHSRMEKGTVYRSQEEIDYWKSRDPIITYREKLVSEYGLSEAEFQMMEDEISETLEDALAFAESSPSPEPDEFLKYVYAT